MAGGKWKQDKQKAFIDPENLYNLNGAYSAKSLCVKPGQNKTTEKEYGGSPGAPSFCVGNNKTQQEVKQDEVIEIDIDEDSKVGTVV